MNSAGEWTSGRGQTAAAVGQSDRHTQPEQESAPVESALGESALGESALGESALDESEPGKSQLSESAPSGLSDGERVSGNDAMRFREKLYAPASYWFIGLLFGLSLAIIMLVVGPWWSLIALIVGTALSECAVIAYGNQLIEVSADGVLRAGTATLPASALGPAVALDAERARALRTYEADPRAFHLLRSYVATAVRVEVADPADPTPYLYLSSRRPKQLAAVVNALPR